MGIDLTLLPFDAYHEQEDGRPPFCFSHTMLDLPRDYDLWAAIRGVDKRCGMDTPEGFTHFLGGTVPDGQAEGECYYGDGQYDPYGERLRCVPAGKLAAAWEAHQQEWWATGRRKMAAAHAYLRELPPSTWVALYWH